MLDIGYSLGAMGLKFFDHSQVVEPCIGHSDSAKYYRYWETNLLYQREKVVSELVATVVDILKREVIRNISGQLDQ